MFDAKATTDESIFDTPKACNACSAGSKLDAIVRRVRNRFAQGFGQTVASAAEIMITTPLEVLTLGGNLP